MASVSKNALIMQNRIKYFFDDVELVSYLCVVNSKTEMFDACAEINLVSKGKYESVGKKISSKNSRNLLFQHLRKMVYIAVIKEIYEEFSEYLRTLVESVAIVSKDVQTAGRIIGDSKIEISGLDVLGYSSLEELKKAIADDIVRQLEREKSTVALIDKICKRCNLSVCKSTINEALPYLELRHLLVHMDGKADQRFKECYGKVFSCNKDGFVNLNSDVVFACKEKVEKLMLEIDRLAIEHKILEENTPAHWGQTDFRVKK